MIYFRTRTPKGDGNCLLRRAYTARRPFQNTNPERGRKHVCVGNGRSRNGTISEHEPRKGTETFASLSPTCQVGIHFRTRTPKGDGNDMARIDEIIAAAKRISEHEPRKGTETKAKLDAVKSLAANFRTRTPKGDGNAAVEMTVIADWIAFQNTNPERGRKPKEFSYMHKHVGFISEHEPRKGTETC